ncbi:MAG: cytochrome bc1 complex Rieske iron-sulfur subunit [Motilibacteraceae bacterium]
MSEHSNGSADVVPAASAPGGLEQQFPDPGLPAHVHRRTDIDATAAKRAERTVVRLFLLSIAGTVLFVVAWYLFPVNGRLDNVATSRLLLGLGLGLALFCIGVGAVYWAKKLMPDVEVVEDRHPIASTPEEREGALEVLREGGEATGFGRRKMIWGSLTGALGALALPAIIPLKDLWIRDPQAKQPAALLSETMWKAGTRIVTDPLLEPIKATDIELGSVVHVLPEGIDKLEDPLDEKAKSAVLLIRLEPSEVAPPPPGRENWSYNGIYAYSKICTHMGCPVALYEQQTHNLLCPCHQSTFDVTQYCKVVFGPAARPLPQLAITVDADGYLVAQQGFTEPTGPSFWERG